jgi:hypothetical protein
MRVRYHIKSKPFEISTDEFDELVKKGKLTPKALIKDKSIAGRKWVSIDNLERFHEMSPIEYPPGTYLIQDRAYERDRERDKKFRKKYFPTDKSFNEDFCNHLEYRIGWSFKNTDQEELWDLWCDGVYPLDATDPQIKSVNATKKIEIIAYIVYGQDGGENYNMTIRLGECSLRRYAKGESLIECIPSNETMDWVDIDIENKIIELRLK